MMKRTIFVLVLILSAVLCFSQQTIVAVAPFEAKDGISAANAMTITEIFGIELQATGKVRVVSRTNFEAMMKEHRFQLSDLSDDKKTAQLGKALSANWITRGQVQKLGALIVVTATLMDVNTTEIVGGAPMYLNKIEEAPEKIPTYMETIKQRIETGNKGYERGDRGPGGGYIVYDKGVFSNGWRYLEIAPSEAEFIITNKNAGWSETNYPDLLNNIGSGMANTKKMAEYHKNRGETNSAAQLCLNLDFNGYKDWFLPCKAELYLCDYKSGNSWYWYIKTSAYREDYRYNDDHELVFYWGEKENVALYAISHKSANVHLFYYRLDRWTPQYKEVQRGSNLRDFVYVRAMRAF